MESSSPAVHPTPKKVQTHLRLKKGSNQNPSPTNAACRQCAKSTVEWFDQAFFLDFLPPLVEVTVRIKYAIILFKRGLPVWGGVRVREWWGSGGGYSFKVKVWVNRINKAGFLCLSSALSAVLSLDISMLLMFCKRDQQRIPESLRRLFQFIVSVWLSCHSLPRLSFNTITVMQTPITKVIVLPLISHHHLHHHHQYNHLSTTSRFSNAKKGCHNSQLSIHNYLVQKNSRWQCYHSNIINTY